MHELAPKGMPLKYTNSRKGIHSQWSFMNGEREVIIREIVPVEDGEFRELTKEERYGPRKIAPFPIEGDLSRGL